MRQTFRWRQIVANSTSGETAIAASRIGPSSKQIDQKVSTEFGCQHLRDNVKIGDKCGLQDDRNVTGVEQLDWVRALLSAITSRLDR